jgi:catecholate siderophore receptor
MRAALRQRRRERFFGDPEISHADADVNLVTASVEWRPSDRLVIRNRAMFGDYDKFYQNVFAGGAATGTGPIPTSVPLQGYNNRIDRRNLFNQTDLVWQTRLAGAEHTVLAGVELGRQTSDNRRNTGFFDNLATTRVVPFAAPTVTGETVVFRQSPTDADSHVRASVGAVYLQDQAELSPHLQLIGGARFDRFELDFRNNRNGQRFSRRDDLVSPRLGLVVKPVEPVSLYASYSVSYLPSSGDQFSSLTSTTVTLEPEKFTNREVGLKWDLASGLAVTAAAYQLDRDNTSAPDPDHPGFVVHTGAQRARGVELGVSGKVSLAWQVIGGYGWQEVEIVSTTSAAPAGRRPPLTPAHTASLWNKWTLSDRWAVGLGAGYRSKAFAAIDNAVVLPGFTRLDAAVFLRVNDKVSAQLNVENLLDERYFATSQGNNNIAPGAPRTVRVSVQTRF